MGVLHLPEWHRTPQHYRPVFAERDRSEPGAVAVPGSVTALVEVHVEVHVEVQRPQQARLSAVVCIRPVGRLPFDLGQDLFHCIHYELADLLNSQITCGPAGRDVDIVFVQKLHGSVSIPALIGLHDCQAVEA